MILMHLGIFVSFFSVNEKIYSEMQFSFVLYHMSYSFKANDSLFEGLPLFLILCFISL